MKIEVNSYYECHVTFLPNATKKNYIKKYIEDEGWRFSAIDGDIIEGNGVKYYATKHFKTNLSNKYILERLLEIANLITKQGFTVTRRKIEHVIFDDKSSKICPIDCRECILDK